MTPTLGLLGLAVFATWSCVLPKGWVAMGEGQSGVQGWSQQFPLERGKKQNRMTPLPGCVYLSFLPKPWPVPWFVWCRIATLTVPTWLEALPLPSWDSGVCLLSPLLMMGPCSPGHVWTLPCLWEIVINSLFCYAFLVHVAFVFHIKMPLSQPTSFSTFTFPTVSPITVRESDQWAAAWCLVASSG